MLVISGQSLEPAWLLELDHGATSEITIVLGTTACVTASVKATVASGEPPTVGSSTATLTLNVGRNA